MSIRHHLKLGRDWHVKAGFTDNHPLTVLHHRPVGGTTSWLRVREHKAAVTLANSLIHVMGNFAEKSPFEKRDGLRLPGEYDPLIEKGVANFTYSQNSRGSHYLAAELFFHNGAYVVLARDGAMIAEWPYFAEWISKVRRGQLDEKKHHVRLYLKT